MSIAASIDFSSRLRKTPPAIGLELSALQGVAVLSGLTPNALAAIAAGSTLRRFSRRGVLAAEGSVPPAVFVVLSGRVRAVRRADSGREVTLETFQTGDLLPDAAVAPERPLSSEWEASEPTDVLAINREIFVAQLEAAPGLALTMMAQMLTRLERSKHMASGLALADVPGRVISALRGLAESQGQSAGAEGVVVQNRPTQQELANSIGACRETVSRVVSDLARRGLITPRGRALVISRRLLDGTAL
jgi:CRP-like cAMP-binding protein